jgi:hypothetical protein
MAERGGQPGNTNATKNKVWIEALNRSIAQDDGKRLRAAAEKLLDLAVEGNVPALKELGDRLDGKPAQAVTLSGDPENPVMVQEITRQVVKP